MSVVVRARVEEKAKKEATKVLRSVGLTLSDASRMMVVRIVAEKKLPFDPLIPNAKTIAAMKEIESGKAARFSSVKKLMADLND